MPNGAEALDALSCVLERFAPTINDAFAPLRRERAAKLCYYSARELLWTPMLGFLSRLRSRNQMDERRNEEGWRRSVASVTGGPVKASAACSQTVQNFLRRVDSVQLQAAATALVETLLRSKFLDKDRVFGCVPIAVDGTLSERKRSSKLPEKEKRRYMLDAAVVTPWGGRLFVMSEPVAPYETDAQKQDCEWNAFQRLAPRLKARFPNLRICLIGDALYACDPIVKICEKYGWKYIVTFKKGRTPTQWDAALSTMERLPQNSLHVKEDKEESRIRWAPREEISYELGETPNWNVVQIDQTKPEQEAYCGAFATNFDIRDGAGAKEIAVWGRRRWNLENGFKTLKHEGFGLEHTFCNDETAGRNMHTLMLLAYTLWQVFARGMLWRLESKLRKPTQRMWARLLHEWLHVVGLPEPRPGRKRRLRRLAA